MKPAQAIMLFSEQFRGHHYGTNHPLSIPRVALTIDLINCHQALTTDELIPARKARTKELTRFHTIEYIQALKACETNGRVTPQTRQDFNLGNFENPYFQRMFTIPALATGASIQAAEWVIKGHMAFNPAGGMHHAIAGKARGFCYLNDAVMAILTLKESGMRVLYLDIDAHHGDGVEQAFDNDNHVLTVSLHMDTAYTYPQRGGKITDTGASGHAVNLPLPKAVNDSEYRYAFHKIWPAVLSAFNPDAVVLQAGTDMLKEDPLGKFNISNNLFLDVIETVKTSAPTHANTVPRLLILGGGGYHPIALARCWTRVWFTISGHPIPQKMPDQAGRLLKTIDQMLADRREYPRTDEQLETLYDTPINGPIRDRVKKDVNYLLNSHPLFHNIVHP